MTGEDLQILLENVRVSKYLRLDVELLVLYFVQSQEFFDCELDFSIDDVREARVDRLQVPVFGQLFEDLGEALVYFGHLFQFQQQLSRLIGELFRLGH